MSYEYKYHIKHDLEYLDEYSTLSGVYKLNQKLKELDEVYDKAEAFDEIEETHHKYMENMQKQFDEDMTGTNLHVISVGSAVLNHFADKSKECVE